MPRLLISIALMITLLFLLQGIFSSPVKKTAPGVAVDKEKKAKPIAPGRPVSLYPQVPSALPDFDKGYIFSAERSIEGEAKPNQENVRVDIDDIVYEGSLIAGDTRQAILAYPGQRMVAGRNVRSAIPRGRPAKTELNHVLVSEGEMFSGYKVVLVSPEKIVFAKGGEKIEKVLYDSEKQREIIQPAPTPRQSPVVTPPMPPQSTPPATSMPTPPAVSDQNNEKPASPENQRQIRTFRRPPFPAPPPSKAQPGGSSRGVISNPFDNGR